MEINTRYHVTTERFELSVDDEVMYIEVDRFDPRFAEGVDVVTGVRIRLSKIVDGNTIPFDNEFFINNIMSFLMIAERKSLLNNVGRKLPFRYIVKTLWNNLRGKK